MQRLEDSDLVKLVKDSEGIKVKVKVANCPLPIDENCSSIRSQQRLWNRDQRL